MKFISRWLGTRLARYLAAPGRGSATGFPVHLERLAACLQPGDIVLVEGVSRISTAIKYLTQSTWSHAALYVGPIDGKSDAGGQPLCLVEADVVDGVRAISLASLAGLHCRVCRAVSLRPDEVRAVCDFVLARLGHRYDLRNVLDLMRYLLPTPPVPMRWRRRMLALGSGDPTRAICSTLVAQAFDAVRYPILPRVETTMLSDPDCVECVRQIHHVRHHSLYTPRDFDVSPYFQIVKPTIAAGFDHHTLIWAPHA